LTQNAAAANGSPPQIWLAGEDPVVQKDKHKDQPADYMEMFKPGAPWGTAASGLTAIKAVLHRYFPDARVGDFEPINPKS
jgi:hypothetical protein